MLESPRFNGKLLLFGEHLINRGGKALALPAPSFYGQFGGASWQKPLHPFDHEQQSSSNASIQNLYHFLHQQPKWAERFNFERIAGDLANGLYFAANIPQGYGLGSSGALVAALLAVYGYAESCPADLVSLRSDLAAMESFFHGKSSGLDPLVTATNAEILLNGNEIACLPKVASSDNRALQLFVIDSGRPRKTAPMVAWFLKQCEESRFNAVVEQELIPASDACIDAYVQRDSLKLWNGLKCLSKLQLQWLHPLIPNAWHEPWAEGLKSGNYYLKLCGAGGGGFIIGVAPANLSLEDLPFASVVTPVLAI
ncbi:MAG: hypothetical protein U0T84_11030 [Chitinophagales bacterium]